jgi:hypothetical protein
VPRAYAARAACCGSSPEQRSTCSPTGPVLTPCDRDCPGQLAQTRPTGTRTRPARTGGVAWAGSVPGRDGIHVAAAGQCLGAEDAGEQSPPGAGVCLSEDGLEVILDRVLGHEHQLGDVPGGRAGGDMA